MQYSLGSQGLVLPLPLKVLEGQEKLNPEQTPPLSQGPAGVRLILLLPIPHATMRATAPRGTSRTTTTKIKKRENISVLSKLVLLGRWWLEPSFLSLLL